MKRRRQQTRHNRADVHDPDDAPHDGRRKRVPPHQTSLIAPYECQDNCRNRERRYRQSYPRTSGNPAAIREITATHTRTLQFDVISARVSPECQLSQLRPGTVWQRHIRTHNTLATPLSNSALRSRALRPQARKGQQEIPAEEHNGRPANRFARF